MNEEENVRTKAGNNKVTWIFEQHLNKYVTVAIPHRFEISKLFFYDGLLKAVSDDSILIELKDGTIKQIFLREIIDLKVDERRGQ